MYICWIGHLEEPNCCIKCSLGSHWNLVSMEWSLLASCIKKNGWIYSDCQVFDQTSLPQVSQTIVLHVYY